MKKCIKILKASDLERLRLRAIILAIFSRPCFAALSIFIVTGHLLAYDWDLISLSWNPRLISPLSGMIYINLIVVSVLAHELGHMSAAIYRGDPSAKVFLKFNSWLPTFMTKGGSMFSSTIPGNPSLSLAGVYFQLLFASFLGLIFFLKGYTQIPASILLIDMGVLASLAPTPGTDGYWFLVDLQRQNSPKKPRLGPGLMEKTPHSEQEITTAQKSRIGRISFALGINLTVLYVIASAVLLLVVSGQMLNGFFMRYASTEPLNLIEFLAYLTLLIPMLVYASWAALNARFVLPIIMNLARSKLF